MGRGGGRGARGAGREGKMEGGDREAGAPYLLLVVEPGDNKDGHLAAPREPAKTRPAKTRPKRKLKILDGSATTRAVTALSDVTVTPPRLRAHFAATRARGLRGYTGRRRVVAPHCGFSRCATDGGSWRS